jgi:predicted dithiol-disulfide oxidoreductase (DUF899 family)
LKTPPIVSPQDWEAARQQLLVKEKELTHARDALAAERRRMPWVAVEKDYAFEGPQGTASLLDLFEGRSQLIVYRAFFEPGVYGWPEHACRGCSMVADQVAHVAHLNARDITLVFASRAPQADIERVKARMGWEMRWYTMTDGFDADFGVDEWHGTNVFLRDGERVFRTYFINNRGDEMMGGTWTYLDITPLGRQEEWEDSPEGYPQTPPYTWWTGTTTTATPRNPRHGSRRSSGGSKPSKAATPRDRSRRRRAGGGDPAAVGERRGRRVVPGARVGGLARRAPTEPATPTDHRTLSSRDATQCWLTAFETGHSKSAATTFDAWIARISMPEASTVAMTAPPARSATATTKASMARSDPERAGPRS